ncbi:cation:proton antiporter [Aquabacterium sp.]|uniref:cation:proton antiporter n=1 Tax=Aquabacterium sp. TaxID=1872578 RepID=UPI0019C5FE3C|nr:cation:proton antiporter [Aquabacterium sp.]MBC7700456.1 cation:proton antiporter [Aquabacterium sp.]
MSTTQAATQGIASSAVHQNEMLLYFVLLQLIVIVMAARLGGTLAKRLGQSPAVGEIVVGILLGPSLFGLLMPDVFHYVFRSVPAAPLTILSQIGLILLMFQIGMEFDFSHLTEKRNRKAVWGVALAGLVAPFLLGLGSGYFLAPILSPQADRLASALFVATAFSITALPILGRIMMEFNITRSPLGVIAISAAAINDVVGWLLLALITTITVSHFEPMAFGLQVVMVAAFFVLSWYVARPLIKRLVHHFKEGNDALPPMLMGLLLSVMFAAAIATYQLGIFAIFGGFMAGVILHDEAELVAAWKQKVGGFVLVFFLPIFFTYTGLRTNIGGLDTMAAWGWTALLISLATLGKFGGCYLAARWAGLNHAEGKVIGIMMNTRALMELIVLNVGLDLGVISQQMFTMLVLMAIVSTVITAPGLSAWLPAVGLWPAKRKSDDQASRIAA